MTSIMPFQIERHESLDSTNRAARDAARQNRPDRLVIVADRQTAGRGRLGREWESPSGRNLYFSILLHAGFSREWPSELAIVTACSLARSLSKISKQIFKLRWPNDIYCNERKVAGILLEWVDRADTQASVVVGVGINVNSRPEDFSPALQQTATSLKAETGRPFDRTAVLTDLLSAMDTDLAEYGRLRIQPFLKRWMIATDLKGQRIHVEQGSESWDGTFVGLDPHGALQATLADGTLRTVVAADVTKVSR